MLVFEVRLVARGFGEEEVCELIDSEHILDLHLTLNSRFFGVDAAARQGFAGLTASPVLLLDSLASFSS